MSVCVSVCVSMHKMDYDEIFGGVGRGIWNSRLGFGGNLDLFLYCPPFFTPKSYTRYTNTSAGKLKCLNAAKTWDSNSCLCRCLVSGESIVLLCVRLSCCHAVSVYVSPPSRDCTCVALVSVAKSRSSSQLIRCETNILHQQLRESC